MLWTLLVFAAAVLWWRRLAGALAHPLEPLTLLGVAVAVAGSAVAIRLALRGPVLGWVPREFLEFLPRRSAPLAAQGQEARISGRETGFHRCLPWAVSAAVLALGAALSLRDTSVLGLALFWTVLAGEELWGWTGRRPGRTRPVASVAVPTSPGLPPAPLAPPTLARQPDKLAANLDESELDAAASLDVLQQLIRRRAADGGEILSGWLRVPLAASQRTANVHVAFCPPFPRTPQVAVEQLDGPAARIKKVQVLPYGVRLDLKLVEISDTADPVVLHFSALCGPPVHPASESVLPAEEGREPEPLD